MKRLLISIVPILVLVLMSCPGKGPADYNPLEVGYKWEYETITTTIQHLPTDTITSTDTTISTTEITGTDKLSSGEEVYVAVTTTLSNTTVSSPTMKDTTYIRKDEDSVYVYQTLEDTVPYKEPVELGIGTTWTWSFTQDTITTTLTYKVESKEDVTVTAGAYKDCLKISTTQTPPIPNTTLTQYQYRAEDVGTVKSEKDSKMETEYMSIENLSTTELQSFTK